VLGTGKPDAPTTTTTTATTTTTTIATTVWLQMFTVITRLVLKAKKDQQARLMQVHVSDTVRLAAHSGRSSAKRRKKCC